MKITSKTFIIFALMCVSATVAYSQDCNSYLQRATELVSQKNYCDAEKYYQAYANCNSDADVSTEIALCEKFCKNSKFVTDTVSIPAKVENVPVTTFVPPENRALPANESAPVLVNSVERNKHLPANNDGKATVVIAPAEVQFPDGVNNMIVGATGESGYVGSYVTAALTKQLKRCDKIRLLDPSVMQELGLSARYMVKVTMQKPDVALDVGTSVSLGGLLGAAQNVANNYGGSRGQRQAAQIQQMRQVAPENVSKDQVKVSVNAIAEIIDRQTGEILLTTDPVTGKASGTPQIGIDLPAAVGAQTSQYDPGYSQPQTNNGININKGAVFSQTVTGKAIEKAIEQIGKELVNYFNNQLDN